MIAWQPRPTAPGWHWVRELPPDMPPQLIERHEIGHVIETGDVLYEWRHWTVAGWAPLTGDVCPIGERPPG